MILILDSKERADKYVEAGLVDKFEEIEFSESFMTSEQLKASWEKGDEDEKETR